MSVYACTQCSQTFPRSDLLAEHSARHAAYQERPFPCLVCGKRFTEKRGLKDHATVHKSDRPRFPCEMAGCSKSFLNQKSAMLHMVQMHPNVHLSVASVKGESAGPVVKASPATKERINDQDTVPISPPELASEPARILARHACDVAGCGKVLQTAYYLRVHMRWHDGLPPYECSACSSAFTTAKELKAHRDGSGHNRASQSSNSAEKHPSELPSASAIHLKSSQSIIPPLASYESNIAPNVCTPLSGPEQLREVLVNLRALVQASPAGIEGPENMNTGKEESASGARNWRRNVDTETLAQLICGEANSMESMAPIALWAAIFSPAGRPTAPVAKCDSIAVNSIATNISVAADQGDPTLQPLHTRKRSRTEASQGSSMNCSCQCYCTSASRGPEFHSVASQAVPHAANKASRGTSPDSSRVLAASKCSVSSGPDPLDTLYLEAMAGSDLVNPLESHDFSVERTSSPGKTGRINLSSKEGRDSGVVGVSIGVGTDFWGESSEQMPWRASASEPRTPSCGAAPKRGVNAGTDPIDFDADLIFQGE